MGRERRPPHGLDDGPASPAAPRPRGAVAAPWGGPAAALDACAACGGGHSWGRERRPPHELDDGPASPAAPRPRGAVAPPWGGPAAALDACAACGGGHSWGPGPAL